MGAFGAPGDPPGDVPDRAATVAALGLWLTLIDDARGTTDATGQPVPADERLTRPAAAAARWLVKQQTKAGAFPAAYPPDAPPGATIATTAASASSPPMTTREFSRFPTRDTH